MHKKVDRARLFLSFDALKGFKELLQEGDEVELVYYTGSSYSKIRGTIQIVNLNDHYIYINDHKIQLKNIFSLEL